MTTLANATAAPAANNSQCAEPARTGGVSRDDVLRIVREAPAWRALPIAALALGQVPGDGLLRLLYAARLAEAGLKTAAGEELESLPRQAQELAQAAALRAALRVMQDDRIDVEVVAERVRRRSGEASLAWRVKGMRREWFRMRDGSLVWREEGEQATALRGVMQNRLSAAQVASKLVRADQPFTKSVVVSGLDNPWLLYESWAATAADAVGYTARLYVVEGDESRWLDALALPEFEQLARDERVVWCLGPGAMNQLEQALMGQVLYALPDRVLAAPGGDEAVAKDLGGVLGRAHLAQSRQMCEHSERVQAYYARRDRAWWAERFSNVDRDPPRVLILTTRFTTYVKYAAEDLAAALCRGGVRATVLMEPDAHSRLSGAAYAKAIDDARPDLVVLINYPRGWLGGAVPANVPFMCWMQDALPHLFDSRVGAAQGELDFVMGHLFAELFDRFGYDAKRAMPTAVVACGTKFHAGAVDPAMREKFECELALVSHHSETPEAMQARLEREASSSGADAIALAIKAMYEDVANAVDRSAKASAAFALGAAVRMRLREALGREPDDRTQTLVLKTYAMPLADRMLRHQTLGWAAAVAEKRGWRLHLYGKGWESHPLLGKYAKGVAGHGEELRAIYASARAQLHITINALVHQRVLECFLSGGLCLCRMHYDALAAPNVTAQLKLLDCEPDRAREQGGERAIGYSAEKFEVARELAELRERLGYPLPDGVVWISEKRAAAMRRARARSGDVDLCGVVGDMSQVVFKDAAELERLLVAAVEDEPWRGKVIAAARERIGRAYTHDVLARRMVDFVGASLRGASTKGTGA